MKKVLSLISANPASVVTAVNGIMGLLIAFNVLLTQTQMSAVDVALNGVMAVVANLAGRTPVVAAPPAK